MLSSASRTSRVVRTLAAQRQRVAASLVAGAAVARLARAGPKCEASTAAAVAPAAASQPTVPLHAPSPLTVVLYQYDTCPFCNKLRAYLDFARIPYVVVEVNPLTKGEIAWSRDYRKVPIAVVNGVALRDSSAIIDALEVALKQHAERAGKLLVPQPQQQLASLAPLGQGSASESRWRAWVDDVLVKHLTVNIYRTPGEALATFDYLTQRNFPAWVALPTKAVGAAAMVMVARKRKAGLGLAAGEDERAGLVRVLGEFMAAVQAEGGGRGPFMGGAAPNLADISVFGVLRAIAGLPTHTEALAALPSAAEWYHAMEEARVRGCVAGAAAPAMVHRVFSAPGDVS